MTLVVSLSACCGQKASNLAVPQALTVKDVLETLSDQIGQARQSECDRIKGGEKVQRLNVYLDTVEITLELKRDNTKDGKLSVNLPVIGELVPSGSYEQTVQTTADNTLVLKFTGIKPPGEIDPCDGRYATFGRGPKLAGEKPKPTGK